MHPTLSNRKDDALVPGQFWMIGSHQVLLCIRAPLREIFSMAPTFTRKSVERCDAISAPGGSSSFGGGQLTHVTAQDTPVTAQACHCMRDGQEGNCEVISALKRQRAPPITTCLSSSSSSSCPDSSIFSPASMSAAVQP